MTADQPGLPGMLSAAEHEADLRSRGLDPTPRGVVRAVLEALCDWWTQIPGTASTFRVLDVCAGYGVWASEWRRLWHVRDYGVSFELPLHITGVEIDQSKREHLAKWCDEPVIDTWRPDMTPEPFGYQWAGDLIIGNPDFSHILRRGKHRNPNKRTDYRPVEETMVPVLLRHAPEVLLLHTTGAFTDSPHGREVWRRYPPAATWLCGRISFRSDGKTDSRCYQATLWQRGHRGPCATHMLPALPYGSRRWTTLPGTEDAQTARAMGFPIV